MMEELSIADLFAGNSERAALIRSHFANVKDVAGGVPTPLGAVETWSPSLKSVFGILLNSGCPMFLVWDYAPLLGTSDERILFYNEAYLSLLNETQHLNPCGRVNNRWTEDWGMIQADVEQVLTTGQALQRQQNLMLIDLNGKGNGLLYTWSYNAVWDDTGQIRGVFATGCPVSNAETDSISYINSLGEGYFSLIHDISEVQRDEIVRKQMERERFLSVGSDLLVITGTNGYFQWVSPTFERTLGWTVDEMTSRPWTDFVHPDDIGISILETDSLFSGNETIAFENRYRHKDGSYRWFLWRAQPYPAEQVIYGAAVDITERKQAEATLQAKSAELQHVTETVGVGLTRCSRDLRYLSANPAYAQLAGIGVEEIVGRPIVDVMGEAALETIRPHFERVLCGERVEYEAEVPFATGGVRYLHVVYTSDKDGNENIIGWIASVMDISDRKQAEAERERLLGELAAERAQFEAVLRQMPEGVMIADAASGNLILANEQTNQILRYDYTLNHDLEAYEQQVPFQAYRTNGQLYAADEYPLVRSLQLGEVVMHEEMAICYADGSRIVIDVKSSPVFDSQGHITSAVVVFQDITERQQIEQALRASETLYRTLSEAVPDFIWSCDGQGQADFVNSRWIEYTGLTIEQLNAGGLDQVNHPDDFPRLMEQWESAAQKGEAFEAEFRYRRWDGEYRWFMGRAVPIKNDDGTIMRWIGTTTDIHDRKQAEETLRQSEERLRLAMEGAQMGTWDVDLVTGRAIWSDYHFTILGYEPVATGEATEAMWNDRIHSEDLERVTQEWQQSRQEKRFYRMEYRVVRADTGQVAWLAALGRFTYNHQGEATRSIGVLFDITHRKQIEMALVNQEQRYRYIFEAVDVSIWEEDFSDVKAAIDHLKTAGVQDFRQYFIDHPEFVQQAIEMVHLRDVNQVSVQMFGAQTKTDLLNSLDQIFTPETQDVFIEELLTIAAGESRFAAETALQTLQGARLYVWFSITFPPPSEPYDRVLVSLLDITDRKQAEAEREQLLVQEQATREVAEAAEQQAEFLAAASETLASSLDYEYTLKSVAQAVVPTLADWCAVDILNDDGTLERLATAHVDPAKVQWGLELHRRYPSDLNAPRGIGQVLRTGQSEYYPTISDDLLVASAQDDEHLRILREIGFSSVMLVPLNARGRTLGTLCFVAAESGRLYSPEDLSLAEELARRGAIALDNARLYRDAQQARQAAERAADRTSRLQMVTAALSESLTPAQVAEVIVEQSMATLEATAALVVLVSTNRTELEIVKSVGYHADLVEAWHRFSINTDVPLAEAIRTGEPVWVETILDRIVRYPHLAEIYNRYEFNAWIVLPLVVEGRSIGGMLLSFTEVRLLNQEDRDFILALTRQCAQAIVRAQLYEAERQARAEAEQANRIKDEFLAVLSHELRSPLNPILGWSKLLQNGTLDAAKTQQALKTIERNAHLQAELIEDLLDVSRILQGKLNLNVSSINLVFLIRAAMETVRLAAEAKSIQVESSFEPDLGLVFGDATRLQQVIWNLLSNAVKFTPTGGQVSIQLERLDSYVQITVSDTGQGIAPEFLPYVFDYFRQSDGTTTRRFGGLGLGLAIVRHLVELHGGTVGAQSPGIDRGATFTVRLPLMSQPAIAHQTAQSSALSSDLQGIHVLVVDDEPDSREFVAFVLEQAGATVLTATTAAEALTLLMQSKPTVLLSDIGMPEMDGYMLMQQVRALPTEHGGQVPAIALTAYAGEMNQQQALAAGFQHHLAKPIEPEALVSAIAQITAQPFKPPGLL